MITFTGGALFLSWTKPLEKKDEKCNEVKNVITYFGNDPEMLSANKWTVQGVLDNPSVTMVWGPRHT